MIKKVIFIFSVRWPLLLKNACHQKIFFTIFSKKVAFLKKLWDDKIFKTLFPIKKRVIFVLVARRPLPFKRNLGSKNSFLAFSHKIELFLKKLLNKKIFRTSFVIKKSYVGCRGKTPPFSKKLSNVPPKQFFKIFSENTVFFRKIVE